MTNTPLDQVVSLSFDVPFDLYKPWQRREVLRWLKAERDLGQKQSIFIGTGPTRRLRLGRYDFYNLGQLAEFVEVAFKYDWSRNN